jgi:hypothetical protein
MPKKESSATIHKLEKELLSPVMHYLYEIGCQQVISELRFFDRGIDVYGIRNSKPRKSYAVELKLTDWKRALQQAAVYQLCSDFSYVAVPIRSLFTIDLNPFKECGVGLLVVRPDCSVGAILEAQKSIEARPHYVEAMRRSARLEKIHVQ